MSRNYLKQITLGLLSLVCLFYGVLCLDENVNMCVGQRNERTLFVQQYSTIDVKYCVRSNTKLLQTIFINSYKKQFGYREMDNTYVTLTENDNNITSQYQVVVHVKNVTSSDYKSHSLIIHNVNESQLTLRFTLKKPGIMFTKSRTIGNIYENQEIKMMCERNAEDEKELRIYKLYEAKKRLDTYVENNKLVYEIMSTKCTDMGRYICEAEDSKATLDIEILNCPPVACTNSVTDETYTTDIGDSVIIRFCIIAFPTIEDNVIKDNIKYEIGTDYSNIYVNKSNDRIYNVIEVKYHKIDAADLTSHVASTASNSGNFNFTFRLQRKELLSLSLIANMSTILCISSQYPTSVSLYKVDTMKPLVSITENVGINESLKITYRPSTEVCNAMGTYECISVNKLGVTASKTIQLILPECPPILCLGYPNMLKREANINVPVILNYCVIDYYKPRDGLLINGTFIPVNNETWNRSANIQVIIKEIDIYLYLTIIIHNMTFSKFGIWNITILSNSSKQLNFYVDIATKQTVTDLCNVSPSKTLLAISVTLIMLSTLCLAISIWLVYFKGKFKLYKILPSSVTSSRVQLPMY